MTNLRNLTGWKAVMAAIVIVGFAGFKGWNEIPRYRTETTKVLDIGTDQAFYFEFTLEKDIKIKADVTEDSGEEYLFYLVTDANYKKLQKIADTGIGNPANVPTIFERECTSSTSVSDIMLQQGKYVMIIENNGQSTLSGRLKMYSYR